MRNNLPIDNLHTLAAWLGRLLKIINNTAEPQKNEALYLQ
jgi:hypothetical protein